MVYKFIDKKTTSLADKSASGSGIKNEIKQNQQLADEFHKPIIKKFQQRKLYSSFRDNIWGADFADMQLLSKFNKGFKILLCVIDIFSKYVWVVPLQNKKGVTIVNAFQKVLDISDHKLNKILVDKGSESYNSSFKKWLKNNDIEMYSVHNEGKSVGAERFVRTLKSKIYKYMTSISKKVYTEKLDDIVNDTTIHIIEQSQ